MGAAGARLLLARLARRLLPNMTQFTKAHCNNCAGERNHAVLHTTRRRWEDFYPDGSPSFVETADYETVQCCGCEEVKLKVSSSGPWPDEGPVYFPPAIFRRKPEWSNDLLFASMGGGIHDTLWKLLSEVYKALQNGMPRLATMGVRAALEVVMVDKVGDQGRFVDNVNKFADEGHIAKNQVPRIMSVLDAGGAVIHRGYAPTDSDVIAMVNLLEHLVESIYFHDKQIEAVAKRVPPRSGKSAD